MRAIALAALLAAVSMENAGAFSLDLTGIGLIGAPVNRAAVVSVPVAGFGEVSFWITAGNCCEIAEDETIPVDYPSWQGRELAFDFADFNGSEAVLAIQITCPGEMPTARAVGTKTEDIGPDKGRFDVGSQPAYATLAGLQFGGPVPIRRR